MAVHVKLDSPVKVSVVSVAMDSQEQTVVQVWHLLLALGQLAVFYSFSFLSHIWLKFCSHLTKMLFFIHANL